MALRIPLIQSNPEKDFQKYLGLVRSFTYFPSRIRDNQQLFENALLNLSFLYYKSGVSEKSKRFAEHVTKQISMDYFIED